ncbi:MAG TPA: LD-carboxypeptidase [Candidatus Acidoferrales bacterium]|jgi:muramoyltetrapeptide carboxypeptidase|nr:LD-carboxypeptidase [Candidatus Acidoferrales bacterium]
MQKSRKPFALAPGSTIAVVAPASSAKEELIQRGCETLVSLDFRVKRYPSKHKPMDYFSAPLADRRKQLQDALTRPEINAVFCSRGGYGSTEILDGLDTARLKQPKIFCAFSDLTSVHIFLWQKLRWVTFYGPLVAGGFDAGPNATNGFDPDTFMWAMTATNSGWSVPLEGETFSRGTAEGTLLGGCITLIETSIGTPWELDTRGSILLLEDRGVRPYHLDRMLMHLRQAGKFDGVRGIILGEFPDCETPEGSTMGVAEVCKRLLAPLKIPIVYGVAVGHTQRPMLTMPLGVRAKLYATGEGRIDILEPAVRP